MFNIAVATGATDSNFSTLLFLSPLLTLGFTKYFCSKSCHIDLSGETSCSMLEFHWWGGKVFGVGGRVS